ncbi:MAG: DNA-binding protein [Hadesarchaea archaeon]|nr:DNA-binding protein [Hadesarchaea archaeon]
MSKFRVILDANFLMTPELHGVDIFSEIERILNVNYELVVPSVVINELETLASKGNSTERSAAKVALGLANRAKKIETSGEADEEIIRLARGKNSIVGTNDTELRKRLREEGVPVIYLRQKSYLNLAGDV